MNKLFFVLATFGLGLNISNLFLTNLTPLRVVVAIVGCICAVLGMYIYWPRNKT